MVKSQGKQDIEVKVTKIEVEGLSDEKYPIQNKRHTYEFFRTISHLRPRSNLFRSVFRIRSLASMAIHEYFQKNGYIYVNTPIITSSDGEGAGEMFKITTLKNEEIVNEAGKLVKQNKKQEEIDIELMKKDFFGKDAFLSVTGQLNGECFAHAFRENIYIWTYI